MKIGAVFPHNEIGTNPELIKEYCRGLESLGVDHLLIYDHVLGADPDREGGFRGPYDKDVAFHEPLTTFSFMAAATEKIELATTVLILPQRQTVLVAKQVAQLAVLSNNRFRLGIGVGWNKIEYEGLNETFENRGRRQEEQVILMRELWTQDSLDFKGEFHRIDKAQSSSILTDPLEIALLPSLGSRTRSISSSVKLRETPSKMRVRLPFFLSKLTCSFDSAPIKSAKPFMRPPSSLPSN